MFSIVHLRRVHQFSNIFILLFASLCVCVFLLLSCAASLEAKYVCIYVEYRWMELIVRRRKRDMPYSRRSTRVLWILHFRCGIYIYTYIESERIKDLICRIHNNTRGIMRCCSRERIDENNPSHCTRARFVRDFLFCSFYSKECLYDDVVSTILNVHEAYTVFSPKFK